MKIQRGLAVSLVVTMLLSFFVVCQANALTLWYNGDLQYDEEQGMDYADFKNQSTPDGYWYAYDDFIVSSSGWNIDTVWSNNLITNPGDVTGIVWEIRSGVSDGNAGSFEAGGSDDGTVAATGQSIFDNDEYIYEYTVMLTGLNVSLAPGTYWLSVAPTYDQGQETSYISMTGGANAIGLPAGDNGNAYYDSDVLGLSFDGEYTGGRDFSMGIGGREEELPPIPEPGTLVLLGAGLAGFLARKRFRRTS